MNSLSRGTATIKRRVSVQEAEGDEMRQINKNTWKIFIVDIFASCNYLCIYFYGKMHFVSHHDFDYL